MYRSLSTLLTVALIACADVPGVPNEAELRSERLAEVGLQVCREIEPAEPVEVPSEEEAAAADARGAEPVLTSDATAELACATCDCDCSQAVCGGPGCIAQPTGAGNCVQSGSSCNGNTCDCDCYTAIGAACPAPGQGNNSPQRITLTNGVGGVVAACAWK